ncbi:hypothetical protein LTS17_009494 [Exophiala oligosperma]
MAALHLKKKLRVIIIGAGYASSSEIKSYLKAVTSHYDLNGNISFKSIVNKASWNEGNSTWTVSVENQGDFECDILINGGGILNNIQYPKIKGLETFKGCLLHTAAWDESVDLQGKRVAIIGAGASAIQTLPVIQKAAKHVDIYIRTPSWIAPPAGENFNAEKNHIYTSEEKKRFRDDPAYSAATRKEMEIGFNKIFKAFVKGSKEQLEFRTLLETGMKARLPDRRMQEKLIPKFEAGCRRISPGYPYLEALQQHNVEALFDPIDEVTGTGIVAGEQHREVDVVIAATGFDTSFRPRFPISGRGGVDLQKLWDSDPAGYFGLAVSGFPNYLMFLGPNTPISNGSLMGTLEATADYFIRLMTKFIDERALQFNVRAEVQRDFNQHTQSVMKNLVWTGACRAWYKNEDGKVTALWPGSSLHYREVLASNRWEDFEWRYEGNRFTYWGHGISKVEVEEKGDLAYYIRESTALPLEAYYSSPKGPSPSRRTGDAFLPASRRRNDGDIEQDAEEFLSDDSCGSTVVVVAPA